MATYIFIPNDIQVHNDQGGVERVMTSLYIAQGKMINVWTFKF